jgi:hypothetical protein
MPDSWCAIWGYVIRRRQMHKTQFLTFTLAIAIASATVFSASPAFAKYGWQCFKTKSRVEYCSCTKFKNHDTASEWIRNKLQKLRDAGKSGDDAAMKSGSGRVEDNTQPENCAD